MARTPSKTLVLNDYINNHIGDEVTVKELSEIADCTIQNVYVYLRTNPDRFESMESMGRGTYRIKEFKIEITLSEANARYKSDFSESETAYWLEAVKKLLNIK